METRTPSRAHALEVIDVIEETADAVSIVFATPADGSFEYRPGQFLTLRVPGTPDDGSTWAPRCYSLSSAPELDGDLKVTVKRTAAGYASNWLCDNAKAGMTLNSLRPGGTFTVRDDPQHLLLLAAGSGITPIMSILRTALATSTVPVTLVYANRGPADVIFGAAIAELQAAHPDRLQMQHWLESERGLPNSSSLRELLPPATTGTSAYMCGPAPFMDAAADAAAAIGIDHARIHREAFSSLTADPFEDTVIETASETPADSVSVTVTLEGDTSTIAWPREQVLLDTLLAKGMDAPYVCREGTCGGCAFRLLKGEVHMLVNETLDKYELENGVRLACQSLPRADELEVEFE